MAVVDFSDSASMLQPLDLKLGDRIYEVRPTADDLARMLKMRRAISLSAFERAEQARAAEAKKIDPPEPRPLRDFLEDEDRVMAEDDVVFTRIQLGDDAYEAMIADGLPFPNIRRMADYSYNYHIGGREYADAMLVIREKLADPDADEDDDAAEFPKASKTGRATASASRTKTASTSATARSRRTSGKSSTRNAAKR